MFTNMKLTSAMNYDMFRAMTDEQRRQFIIDNTREVLVRNGFLQDSDTRPYTVASDYQVLDTHYNERGRLRARLTCRRNGNTIDIEVHSCTYAEKV